jgi:hypothetical protein
MEQQDCGIYTHCKWLLTKRQRSRNQPARPSYIRIRFAVTHFRFPDRQQMFPALVTREFRWQAIEFSSESRGGPGYLKPEIGEFPCIFPWNREPTGGDRFADDCFLRQNSLRTTYGLVFSGETG